MAGWNLPWVVDNGAYANFDETKWWQLVRSLAGSDGCLWVVAPDVVADASATRALYDTWEPRIRALGFPVAFVAQDGETPETIPWERLDCLFIGGTTDFKLGKIARRIAGQAKRRGKLVHMGRVNSKKRMQYAYDIGCDSVDGSSFSKFPDHWILWGLKALGANQATRIDVQGCRLRRVASRIRLDSFMLSRYRYLTHE